MPQDWTALSRGCARFDECTPAKKEGERETKTERERGTERGRERWRERGRERERETQRERERERERERDTEREEGRETVSLRNKVSFKKWSIKREKKGGGRDIRG